MKKIFVLLILLFLSFSSFAKTYYGKEDKITYRVDFAIGDISEDAFKQFCLKDYKYYTDGYLSKEDTEDIFGSDLKNLIEKYNYIIYYEFDEKGNATSATLLKISEEPDTYYIAQGRNTILEVE